MRNNNLLSDDAQQGKQAAAAATQVAAMEWREVVQWLRGLDIDQEALDIAAAEKVHREAGLVLLAAACAARNRKLNVCVSSRCRGHSWQGCHCGT